MSHTGVVRVEPSYTNVTRYTNVTGVVRVEHHIAGSRASAQYRGKVVLRRALASFVLNAARMPTFAMGAALYELQLSNTVLRTMNY